MRSKPGGLVHPIAQDVGDIHCHHHGRSARSSFARQLRDEADFFDARRLEPIEDVHQFLILHAAVTAQVHLLSVRFSIFCRIALLQNLDPDRLVARYTMWFWR